MIGISPTQAHMDYLRSMQRSEGSFYSSIIESWFLAGSNNKQKLESVFEFLIEK
jgi:hypothetical protein|tara:strand:- start:620 stop:781 length:162 start_codon:yes stop_codon:yes gene_type:complete